MTGLPLDPFFRAVRVPGDFSATGRVALLAEVAQALEEERLPSREAGAFVGAVLGRWLREGGSFQAALGTARRGSHRTAQRIHAELSESSSRMRDSDAEDDEDRAFDNDDEPT